MNNKVVLAGGVLGLLLVTAIGLVGSDSNAGETVLIRGIVKEREGNVINVFYTHIATASDKTKWQGLACDVNVGTAKRLVWTNKAGVLSKTRTSAIPAPGKEVVFSGTLKEDCRGTASWTVENYRQYKMTGTLEGVKLDTGSTDSGWLTVNVSKLEMRGIVPARKFKEAQFKGVDTRVRFNGLSKFTALGKAKQADEVTAGQQTVVIEGEMLDEDTFTSSKINEQ